MRALAACLAIAGCATPVLAPSTREQRLARLSLDARERGAAASPGDVVFSPDGRRVAYVVWLEIPPTAGTPGGPIGSYAVVDGKAGPVLQSLSPPVFSPDGAHVAYSGNDGQGAVIFLDGKLRRLPARLVYPPMFGRGGRWAYVESSRFGDEMAIVVNGKRGPWFDYVWPQGFSPDGRKVVYKAKEKGRVFLVVGKQRSRLLDEAGFLWFDERGSTLAYHGCQAGRCAVFVRGRPAREIPRGAERVTPSPDLRRIAYQLAGGGARRWVVDGREQPPFDDAAPSGPFVFAPTGASFAYAACRAGRCAVVASGAVVGEHEEIGAMTFSPDGKTLAYSARDGGSWRVIVDGKPQPTFASVGEPRFAPDGRTVVHTAQETTGTFVVVGAARHGPFTAVETPITFTADGTRATFGARIGDELWWKVIPLR